MVGWCIPPSARAQLAASDYAQNSLRRCCVPVYQALALAVASPLLAVHPPVVIVRRRVRRLVHDRPWAVARAVDVAYPLLGYERRRWWTTAMLWLPSPSER